MQLILAVSKDGYLARQKDDPMNWLGSTDKKLFKMLTSSLGGKCVVSSKTAQSMPPTLEARELIQVSRAHYSLEDAYRDYPNAWLLGGPILAEYAIVNGFLTEAYLCRSDRYAFPEPIMTAGPIPDFITRRLTESNWSAILKTNINDVSVEIWRPINVQSERKPTVEMA